MNRDRMIEPGDVLNGYRVESVLGQGGMGVVYRAHQLSMERAVALKVLSGEHVRDESFRERFRREGRIAAHLDHPNILPVFEAGAADGHLFIAMRLIDGPTMGDLILEQGALRWQRVLEILSPVASALDAAAGAGLVHRDIKPQNILISSGGHPYLADFGLMRLARTSEVTRAGEWLGSPDYAAPEHMTEAVCTAAVDVYSLTAVAFHALTGRVAFERHSDLAVLHAHATAPRPRIAELNPAVPAEVDEVIAWGMAVDPAERAPSASALISALGKALRAAPGEAVLVRSGGPEGSSRGAHGAGSGARVPHPTTDAIEDAIARRRPPAHPAQTGPLTPTVSVASLEASRAATLADPPHVLAEPPPHRTRSRSRSRTRTLLVGAGAAAVALVAAALVLLIGDGSAQAREIQRPSFALQLAGEWRLRPAVAFPTLRLSDRVTAALPDASSPGAGPVTLEAGRLDGARDGPDPLPVAHEARWRGAPTSRRVLLGSVGALRYDAVLRDAGVGERTYVVPTTAGYRVIACRGAQARRGDLESACDEVAATIAVRGARPVRPGPSAVTARDLAAALAAVDTARARQRDGLASKTDATRGRSARTLATAHRAAATAVAETPRGPQDRAALVDLGRSLRALAGGFDRLATAASSGARTRYNQARARIAEAEADLRRSLAALRSAGYAFRRT